MKKKIYIFLSLLLIIVLTIFIFYKKATSVPELTKLTVFGENIQLEKGKRVYSIYYTKDINYKIESSGKCKMPVYFEFENNKVPSNQVEYNGLKEGTATDEVYYYISFDDTNSTSDVTNSNLQKYDYYIHVTFANPVVINENDCINGYYSD